MKNELKRKLKNGEKTLGLWITIQDPIVTELLSGAGFDWFVFDTEHSPMEIHQAQTLMQAMKGTTTPIIRVDWNDPVPVKRALDVGAYGVVIPWVNNKEEAKKAVAACKYPPEGMRGCGPRRCSFFDPDYLKTANAETLVVVQIETREAVNNLEEIATVEGVDVLFIGPTDLSTSYGYLGKPENPEVQKAIDRILAVTKASGIAAGIYGGGGKSLLDRYNEGFQFIAVGGDLSLLRRGATEFLKPFKK